MSAGVRVRSCGRENCALRIAVFVRVRVSVNFKKSLFFSSPSWRVATTTCRPSAGRHNWACYLNGEGVSVYTHGGRVDASEVATRELVFATRRILTVGLVAVVSTIVVVVTPPARRDAPAVVTDKRRGRAGATSAVASVLVRSTNRNHTSEYISYSPTTSPTGWPKKTKPLSNYQKIAVWISL